jgi:kinesin family protein 18/19
MSFSFSHWQGRKGKLYERDATSTHPKRQAKGENNEEVDEDESSEESEAASALRNAWNELAAIERETKRYRDIRTNTEKDLEECRKRGVGLEDVA